MRQHYFLGGVLRERYVNTFGLIHPNYTRVQVYIRSTDYDRTLMSVECLLAAMFPPKGDQVWCLVFVFFCEIDFFSFYTVQYTLYCKKFLNWHKLCKLIVCLRYMYVFFSKFQWCMLLCKLQHNKATHVMEFFSLLTNSKAHNFILCTMFLLYSVHASAFNTLNLYVQLKFGSVKYTIANPLFSIQRCTLFNLILPVHYMQWFHTTSYKDNFQYL